MTSQRLTGGILIGLAYTFAVIVCMVGMTLGGY